MRNKVASHIWNSPRRISGPPTVSDQYIGVRTILLLPTAGALSRFQNADNSVIENADNNHPHEIINYLQFHCSK